MKTSLNHVTFMHPYRRFTITKIYKDSFFFFRNEGSLVLSVGIFPTNSINLI